MLKDNDEVEYKIIPSKDQKVYQIMIKGPNPIAFDEFLQILESIIFESREYEKYEEGLH